MSNKIENYPNIEKLQTILNELAFHQIHQAWIDKKIPQYSLIILERWAEFYNDLEKFTQLNKNKIENLEKEIVELKSITGDNTPKYKRKDYLEALREDNRIIMDEIEKMSKQKNYKSDFVPKSAKILEDLNKHNKILKDRELLI
ncbi:hypothetical protein BSJ75_09205 [Campylobacter coli]|nr:hypothetical protein [Campylobacter coli]